MLPPPVSVHLGTTAVKFNQRPCCQMEFEKKELFNNFRACKRKSDARNVKEKKNNSWLRQIVKQFHFDNCDGVRLRNLYVLCCWKIWKSCKEPKIRKVRKMIIQMTAFPKINIWNMEKNAWILRRIAQIIFTKKSLNVEQ